MELATPKKRRDSKPVKKPYTNMYLTLIKAGFLCSDLKCMSLSVAASFIECMYGERAESRKKKEVREATQADIKRFFG